MGTALRVTPVQNVAALWGRLWPRHAEALCHLRGLPLELAYRRWDDLEPHQREQVIFGCAELAELGAQVGAALKG